MDFCAELALRARVQDLTSKKQGQKYRQKCTGFDKSTVKSVQGLTSKTQDLNTAFKYGISV